MGLFKPAWMSNKKDKAQEAANKTTKQSKLEEVSKKAPLRDIREMALKRLTDQAAIEYVAEYYADLNLNRKDSSTQKKDALNRQTVAI